LFAPPAHADIKIGLVAPFTGDLALGGEQIKRGAEQAINDINAKGGIDGQKLVLYPVDDACDPKQGVTAANKIASEGIKFVTGFYCSSSAIPASKTYMDEEILMVAAGASSPILTEGAKNGTVFRVYPNDNSQGAFIAQQLIKRYRGKRIAILDDQDAWGAGIAEMVKKKVEAVGVHPVLVDSYMAGTRDYGSLITKLEHYKVQVAFIAGFPTGVGLIVRQMKEQGAHIQVIGGDALTTNQFWNVAGPAGNGVLLSFVSDPRKRAEAKPVVAALRKAGFEPEGVTLYAYAAVQTVAAGIERGAGDPFKAAKALRAKPVNTILGPLSFDPYGDITHPAFSLYQWHNGNYNEVKG
ncbi:MAG: branched-chain amino acid ABC transporter substrate-binding protein, partial [Alphaproteobacteria bacterium]|nr:branched-chain amino acid ABC transporter substrate-binding protein [Alphaproteobacteria bacterium]